jgi:basic membrane protein A
MRISSSRAALALLATAAVAFAACSSSGSSPAPSSGTSAAPSTGTSAAPSGSAAGKWKVGFVTDVGQLEDHSFNEYSWKGAQAGATAIGATSDVIVTKQPSDYAPNIQTFIDQKFNIIVTTGFALGDATTKAAKAHPEIKFIGVDQGICVTETGDPDPNFGCKGDAGKLLPNYQGLVYNEAQPGYLVGIIAASISKTGVIGAVGGINTIPAVVKYIKGYQNGALSVNPQAKVLQVYVSTDITKAFNDPATGEAIAKQMLSQKADVIFQVAGLSGQGALKAACDAKVYGIGVDVDQYISNPNTKGCTVTSAEKKLSDTVTAAIQRIGAGTDKGGTILGDASSTPPAIGISPYHDLASLITPDIQKKVDDAFAGMKAGTVDVCKPNDCTKP